MILLLCDNWGLTPKLTGGQERLASDLNRQLGWGTKAKGTG